MTRQAISPVFAIRILLNISLLIAEDDVRAVLAPFEKEAAAVGPWVMLWFPAETPAVEIPEALLHPIRRRLRTLVDPAGNDLARQQVPPVGTLRNPAIGEIAPHDDVAHLPNL